MPATIQIRNVPDTLHRRLKSCAALAGMSLSDDLLDQLRAIAKQRTIEGLEARLQRLPPFTPSVSPARALRALRDRL
jgi:plasmid stability protein